MKKKTGCSRLCCQCLPGASLHSVGKEMENENRFTYQILLRFFTIKLMHDARRVPLLCSKGVTIGHFRYIDILT